MADGKKGGVLPEGKVHDDKGSGDQKRDETGSRIKEIYRQIQGLKGRFNVQKKWHLKCLVQLF